MARQVIWSPEAEQQLDDYAGFISKDSPSYAETFVAMILEKADSLELFSDRGRLVPELPMLEVRELIIDSYRLVYKVKDDQVTIATVMHAKQDFDSAWRRKIPPP